MESGRESVEGEGERGRTADILTSNSLDEVNSLI